MINHTPGPWTVLEHVHAEQPGTYKQAAEGHSTIETSEQKHFSIQSSTKNMENVYGSYNGGNIANLEIAYNGRLQALANAKLVASAPDLLQACKMSEKTLSGAVTQHSSGCLKGQSCDCWLKYRIEALIALRSVLEQVKLYEEETE